MHNREITHIVKTESLSKNQLVVRTKCSFCCHLRETYVKTAKIHPLFLKHNIQKHFPTKCSYCGHVVTLTFYTYCTEPWPSGHCVYTPSHTVDNIAPYFSADNNCHIQYSLGAIVNSGRCQGYVICSPHISDNSAIKKGHKNRVVFLN